MQLLDTHVWLWWMAQDKRLKPQLRCAIEDAERVGVSAISLFEVAWLVQNKRIDLGCEVSWWFEQALGGSNIELLPITPAIAARAVSLETHHSDPQDRLIIATALIHNAQLLSADQKFVLYDELRGHLIS